MQILNGKYDYTSLYQTITHYYPLNTDPDDPTYHAYSGSNERQNLILANIHDTDAYKLKWAGIESDLQVALGKEVIGTSYGQVPSFGAFAVLDRIITGNHTRTKELHVLVSLLGPYYTVIGRDLNCVTIGDRNYRSLNYLVVSPALDFEHPFQFGCELVEQRFNGHRFVPYVLYRETLPGLQLEFPVENGNTIFHALFAHFVDVKVNEHLKIIGDPEFGSESWIKEDDLQPMQWSASPPGQNG